MVVRFSVIIYRTIRPINPEFGVEGDGLVINGGMMDVNGGWMGAGSTRMPISVNEIV